ncbi:hypothetical protein GCM10022419_033130 [Nonomuraea rosea]|uniref:Uncharacterized protein n=1 Tax=Nonomuraea rosea TaxID=638574 RepID=A0ABP6WE52_9ACTN
MSSKLSDDKARCLAQDVERWCRYRWLVMWEPYRRVFTAYPLYDHVIATPVEGKSARKVWKRILDVDQELFLAAVEATPVRPLTVVVHRLPDFLTEVFR